MQWSNILGFNKKCNHDKVPIEQDFYYCPDCGQLIENQWYLVRCSSCGLKIPATIKHGEIIPIENFCHNCGGNSYTVERLNKIDCININYAVLIKAVANNEINEYSQSWIETIQTANMLPKLLK
ncbi:zinc ribbon domain-containing protein [bacterium]|nr:zinc ribbon domain-containing protein [bacterium]